MNIDNVHIITIDHNEEFYKNCINRLRFLNINNATIRFGGEKGSELHFIDKKNTYISVIDKSTFKLYPNWRLPNSDNGFWNRDMTIGEIGCVISHIKAWATHHSKSLYPVLILEQDFNPLFNVNWDVFNEVDNYDWDLILIGRRPLDDNDEEVGLNYFVKPGYSYQAHAYILSKQGLDKIYKAIKNTLKNNLIPTDEFLPALYSTHPRPDIDKMYPNKINALALRIDAVSQTDWEGTGRSRTAP